MDSILTAFDRAFVSIDGRSRQLLITIPDARLFMKPRDTVNSMSPFSVGEYILRSAAMVEQTFGGITTRMWDDPFEWTLPEKLADRQRILQYLDEVEETRVRGFAFFTSDADLGREIPAPEKLTPLIDILLGTLSRAEHFQGRAFAVFQMISDERPPKL